MLVARFAFQACSIDHSDISPFDSHRSLRAGHFRINESGAVRNNATPFLIVEPNRSDYSFRSTLAQHLGRIDARCTVGGEPSGERTDGAEHERGAGKRDGITRLEAVE